MEKMFQLINKEIKLKGFLFFKKRNDNLKTSTQTKTNVKSDPWIMCPTLYLVNIVVLEVLGIFRCLLCEHN